MPSVTVSLAGSVGVSDAELEQLLQTVYVQEGFTHPDVARTAFAASGVRDRGELFVARMSGRLIGLLILVPPGNPACRVARSDEAELHLMAVLREYRRAGIGTLLMRAVLDRAAEQGMSALALSTQPTMHAAHRLYESFGFSRDPERDWEVQGRPFMVFQKRL